MLLFIKKIHCNSCNNNNNVTTDASSLLHSGQVRLVEIIVERSEIVPVKIPRIFLAGENTPDLSKLCAFCSDK